MTDTKKPLKPCPSCKDGGEPIRLERGDGRRFPYPAFEVMCNICGFRGPEKDTEKKADTAWNTRTPDPVVVELVEVVIRNLMPENDDFGLTELEEHCYCGSLQGPENDPNYGDDSVPEPKCQCCHAVEWMCGVNSNLKEAVSRLPERYKTK